MSDLIGATIGNYEITGVIGAGGMATVYSARQKNIRRDVAVKVVKSGVGDAAIMLQRFEREVNTVGALTHPNILKVFDYGEVQGVIYLVMEWQKGGSLAALIKAQTRLDFPLINRLFSQIADALDYAHERGIVHRDLKPQNILIDERGNAILTDFGIAKVSAEMMSLTQTGTAMGTPAYMSPEQWRGETLDARSDVYALGIVLYEMITGSVPFTADTPYAMMHMHVFNPPPSPRLLRPDVPKDVDPVLQMALAKERDGRFNTAGEMAEALSAAFNGRSVGGAARSAPHAAEATAVGISGDLTNPLPITAGEGYSGSSIGMPAPTTALPGDDPPQRRSPVAFLAGIAVLIVAVVGVVALSGRGGAPVVETATLPPTEPPTRAVLQATQNPFLTPSLLAAAGATETLPPTATEKATNTALPTNTVTSRPTNTNTARPTNTVTPPPTKTNTLRPTNTPSPTNRPPTNTKPPTSTPTRTPQRVAAAVPILAETGALRLTDHGFDNLSAVVNAWNIGGDYKLAFKDGVMAMSLRDPLGAAAIHGAGTGIKDGQGALFLFSYSTPIGLRNLYIEMGQYPTTSYHGWNFISDNSNRWAATYCIGLGETTDCTNEFASVTLKPNTWYYLFFRLGTTGRVFIYVWEKENPSAFLLNTGAYPRGSGWSGKLWQPTVYMTGGNTNTILLDTYESYALPAGFAMPSLPPGARVSQAATKTPTPAPTRTPRLTATATPLSPFHSLGVKITTRQEFNSLSEILAGRWSVTGLKIDFEQGVATLKNRVAADYESIYRSEPPLTSGKGLLMRFQSPDGSGAKSFYLSSGEWAKPGYRRLNFTANWSENTWFPYLWGWDSAGKEFTQNPGSSVTLNPNRWYYLFIGVQGAGQFTLAVWESGVAQYALKIVIQPTTNGWAGNDWIRLIELHDGATLKIDMYEEFTMPTGFALPVVPPKMP